ncbi:hypothetical protein FACS189479_07670 [Spirochaetia bacterium]|nr:hypothetical protein FACS189479_07670 [Spirochaetia bacterium]
MKYIKSNAVLTESKESLIFDKLLSFIDNMLLFWQLMDRGYQGYEAASHTIFKDIIENEHFNNFKLFLEKAGLESNISYKKEEDGNYHMYYQFQNQLIDFWGIASTGTKSLVVFYYWLQRIQLETASPSFVFIDEFDAFYHQSLSEFIVKELKKCKCQVILTTHNTSIMTNELLRPDCYLLMKKNRIKSLPELTKKDLREAHNIEKMYLAGAFDE